MIETFKAMDTMLQVYWIAALLASVVFVIQAIGIFLGFDGDTDFSGGDMDFDADGFSLVSIKTIVCFILGFGWTGVLFYDSIESLWLLNLIAFGVGLLFMLVIAFLLHQMMKLTQDNSFQISSAVGKVADVYLRIPAGKTDTGKITVSVDGTVHELEAITKSDTDIPTGSRVRVVEALDGSVVVVELI